MIPDLLGLQGFNMNRRNFLKILGVACAAPTVIASVPRHKAWIGKRAKSIGIDQEALCGLIEATLQNFPPSFFEVAWQSEDYSVCRIFLATSANAPALQCGQVRFDIGPEREK